MNNVISPTDEELERLFPSDPIVSITSTLTPALKIERAFSVLKSKMELALDGRLEPAVYVMSADCGSGKGETVQFFLKSG